MKRINTDTSKRDKAEVHTALSRLRFSVMAAMTGDFPQHEEALRALYAGNQDRFHQLISDWAPDIRDQFKILSKKNRYELHPNC
ncbi:DUF2239 family protein [Paenibacillus sp. PCH8]|uniref:DUF2239 family protein n=1 Tax=Paenibacillus sp. PCH8 TaxID=2066524 RepID=UPI002157B718|nr:DUF2239 family protein [Paenibacillus sp. PCH8]